MQINVTVTSSESISQQEKQSSIGISSFKINSKVGELGGKGGWFSLPSGKEANIREKACEVYCTQEY